MSSPSSRYSFRLTPQRIRRGGGIRRYNVRHTPQRSRTSESASSYDFRKRLRSLQDADEGRRSPVPRPDPDPVRHSLKSIADILAERFAINSDSQPKQTKSACRGNVKDVGLEVDEAIAGLRSAYTKTGESMFESTIDDIAQTYANLDKEISRHADRCTKAQENQDRLYDSIGWPLALTRCSDRIRRRATVEQHLEVMDGKLQDAEKKMKTLEAQWEASYRDEKVAWQAIVKGRGTRDIDAQNRALKAKKEKEAFKKEARAITTTYSQALEKVDEEFKQAVKAEAVQMWQT